MHFNDKGHMYRKTGIQMFEINLEDLRKFNLVNYLDRYLHILKGPSAQRFIVEPNTD